MSEWKETTLGEIVDFKTGKLNSNAAVNNGKYPFFTCSPETFKINNYAFDCEAVLLAGNNANGIYSIKFYQGKFNAYQRTYVITAKNAFIAHLKYVYYLLSLKLNYFKDISQGSATKFLTIEILDNLSIKIPSIQQQKQIADILSCLDNKIDNLRRQNETLEKIAQKLFKHWFIDFEFPNDDGKPYKSSGGAMVASELGDIPEGWRVGKLKELIEVNPTEKLKSGQVVKYVDMKSLSTSSMEILDYIKREFTSGSKFRNNDVLMARITPCLENGKTAFVNILEDNEVGFGSTEFIVLRAKSNCCPHYVYCLTRSPRFRDYSVKNMTGSSGRQRVPNEMIENYLLSIPDLKSIKAYQDICIPVFEKTKSNQQQIQTLTKTRDTLLPKLMSGQIRVKEGESLIEKVK